MFLVYKQESKTLIHIQPSILHPHDIVHSNAHFTKKSFIHMHVIFLSHSRPLFKFK